MHGYGKELKISYCSVPTLKGAQIWLLTSQNGCMDVVGSSKKAGYEVIMAICTYKVVIIATSSELLDDAVRSLDCYTFRVSKC